MILVFFYIERCFFIIRDFMCFIRNDENLSNVNMNNRQSLNLCFLAKKKKRKKERRKRVKTKGRRIFKIFLFFRWFFYTHSLAAATTTTMYIRNNTNTFKKFILSPPFSHSLLSLTPLTIFSHFNFSLVWDFMLNVSERWIFRA